MDERNWPRRNVVVSSLASGPTALPRGARTTSKSATGRAWEAFE